MPQKAHPLRKGPLQASERPTERTVQLPEIAATLADFGFNCIKLTADWQGADLLCVPRRRYDHFEGAIEVELGVSEEVLWQRHLDGVSAQRQLVTHA
jgi:hypothetical protein